MSLSELKNAYHQMITKLDGFHPDDWGDIAEVLVKIKRKRSSSGLSAEDKLKLFSRGTAFITFSYGIDGVSIEISKYAHILNRVLASYGTPVIHLIGGKFYSQADSVLDPGWRRFELEGIDGWDKWEAGKWFYALFRSEMRSNSVESNFLAKEIYQQAVEIAKRLGEYFLKHRIKLVIPVNIASNPGNMATILGLVFVSEIFELYALNSNHDFYWEDGKPPVMREIGENPGVRDHFFRNVDNRSFFSVFESLYPWRGSRWLHTNINRRQTKKLIKKFGFPKKKLFEISTCISDTFFESYSRENVLDIRFRMAHILTDGQEIMYPVPIEEYLTRVDHWMKKQPPIILGAKTGLTVDPRSENLIVLLQPTRVVARKRIEKNIDLINALFGYDAFQNEFEANQKRQMLLHITGPTPKEHQNDLETILFAYKKAVNSLPETFAERLFIAFSTGHEDHLSFSKKGLQPLTIESIYRMADAVVFPSESEGRGLPIIESSAAGIPIICSHYYPKKVFRDVIGEDLIEELQIHYTLFPEGEFDQTVLEEVTQLLFNPEAKQDTISHNKEAVRARYSVEALQKRFEFLLNQLCELD